MKITFQTKEESNFQQRKDFLKLSPSERVVSFFSLIEQLKNFPTKKQKDNNHNFVIVIDESNLERKY